ncbi:MAG: peptide chain release factor 1 [Aquificae bacterium]|nr:peptide chain release factor 1 [Aquificota bacterium]
MGELKETLERLASFEPGKYPVSTLYLRLLPQDREGNKYLRVFKDLVKKREKDLEVLGLDEEAKASFKGDVKAFLDFLSQPSNLRACRGVALFSCSRMGMFEAVKLPYTYRNRLMVAPDPLVREIAAIDEELGKVAVLLVDRKHVRYFVLDVGGIEEKLDFIEPLTTRAHRFHSGGSLLKGAEGSFQYRMPSRVAAPNAVQHGVGEWRFHTRLKEEWHRILKLASDALFEEWKRIKFDKLVIGGFLEEGLKEIERFLHPYLLERLVGYLELTPEEATPQLVWEKTLDLLWEKDREQEKELIKELDELIGRGLAVRGTSRVLEMLAIGNVRTLLIAEDFQRPGYLCPKSHLAFLKPECPLPDEKPLPISDVGDEALEEALDQRATVEVIIDRELQKKVDGMSAFLRFRL